MKTETNNLKQAILERLESERVEPTSRYWFLCTEYAVWALWLAAVVIGAVSFAVVEYISMSNFGSFYEATHESRLALFVDTLSYLWVMSFVVMVMVAYFNLRYTKRGYRYNLITIVSSSLILSVGGGLLLQQLHFGFWLDHELSERIPMYRSLEDVERALWQQPKEGRLVGELVSGTPSDMMVRFLDSEGIEWQLDTMELRHADLELLMPGKVVRILGMAGSSTVFYACGVFPWSFEDALTHNEQSERREEYLERIYAHEDMYKRLQAFDSETYDGRVQGMCAKLPVLPRIKATMP